MPMQMTPTTMAAIAATGDLRADAGGAAIPETPALLLVCGVDGSAGGTATDSDGAFDETAGAALITVPSASTFAVLLSAAARIASANSRAV